MKALRKQVAAWRALITCQSRIVRIVEATFRANGLVSLEFYDVLLTLRYAQNRQMRFRELNQEVLLSRSALSRCIDRMASKGLVKKLNCSSDPRGIEVQLTLAGEQELKKAWPVYRELIVRLFGKHFNEQELEFLAERLSDVVRELP
jgi:DNA-binding MarR family transcriptional regulator